MNYLFDRSVELASLSREERIEAKRKRYNIYYTGIQSCESPHVICNPKVDKFRVDVQLDIIWNSELISYQKFLDFYKVKNLPHDEHGFVHCDLDNFCLLNVQTGEFYPLFVLVPCRHCTLCRHAKQYSYVQRAQFETLQTNISPVFCTLTYTDAYLPPSGLCRTDLQNFKKRFKMNVSRYFGKEDAKRIKFIAFGEYGSRTKRPHYHVMIFGFPFGKLDVLRNKMYKCCNDVNTLLHYFVCWNWRRDSNSHLSFTQFSKEYLDCFYYNRYARSKDGVYRIPSTQLGFCNVQYSSDAAGMAKYVSKYITKNLNVDCDSYPIFRPLISQKLGLDFARGHRKEFLNSPDGTISLMVNGSPQKVRLCSYYFHYLFESLSKMVPCELRRAIDALYYWRSLYLHKSIPYTQEYIKRLKELDTDTPICFYKPVVVHKALYTEKELKTPDHVIIHGIAKAHSIINSYIIDEDVPQRLVERSRYMRAAYLASATADEKIMANRYRIASSQIKTKL